MTSIRITTVHLIERLEQLAAHRTPGFQPDFPVPIGEHHFLRAAAQKLRECTADLASLRHGNKVDEEHPHWAIIDDRTQGVVHLDTNTTKAAMQEFIVNTPVPDARFWVVRAVHIGED